MRALQRKLKSRGGATLLMAMLLMLVAMMVSAVIISAANTSAKSLRARRDSEQAYQTCSSAAIYLRDALVNDKSPYQVKFIQKYNATDVEPKSEKRDDPKTRGSGDIAALADELLDQVMAGDSTAKLFQDDKVPTSTYTFQADGMDPVTVTLKLRLDDKNLLGVERTYLLTADCELESSTSTLCRLTLQMRCGIQKNSNRSGNNGWTTYTAAWPLNCAVIQRQGLGGAS